MNEEKKVKCPFCSELIFPMVKRCPFCKERISKYEEFVEEVVEHVSGGFRWGRTFLVVLYVALVVVGIVYEVKAREVLNYAREMEGKKKYGVAHLSYQTVAKKYSLSYAASEAIVGFLRTDVGFLGFDLPEIEVTFFERLSGGRFDSCYHYGLPLVASVVCFSVCLFMVFMRIFQLKLSAFASLLVVFSGLFFMIQVMAYGWVSVSGSFLDMSIKVMGSYEFVYAVSYMLLIVTAVETLRGIKK